MAVSIDDRHPVARLIENGPNQNQTWADFVEWTMAVVLLRGNAIAEVVTDNRGAVSRAQSYSLGKCQRSVVTESPS